MFSKGTSGRPPKYPNRLRKVVSSSQNSSPKSTGSAESYEESFKRMSPVELKTAAEEFMGIKTPKNNDPNIPDNVLNQLAEENAKYQRITKGKGGSRRKRRVTKKRRTSKRVQ